MKNGTHPTPTKPRGFGAVPDVDADSPPAPIPFPLECLPPAARDMAAAIVAVERVPSSLAGPVVLGILSGSVGAGLEVQSGPHRRTRSNLYVVASAESGSGKSETLRHADAPLLAFESATLDRWRTETLPGAKADAKLLAGDIQRIEKAAGKAPDPTARQALRDDLAEKERQLAEAETAMQAPVLTVEDVTVEKLAVMLSRRDETLFSLSSDAGAIVNNLLGRYNKNDRTDETLYLKAWTGEGCRVDRMGRESVVLVRPCLSALWLVQPDKVESLLAVQALTDGGLLPRLLLCHTGCQPREIVAGLDGAGVDAGPAHRWAATVRTLLETYRLAKVSALVRPDPEALALFNAHFNSYVRRWHSGELKDVSSYAARWTEQAWRIGLCLHAGRELGNAPEIPLSADTARAALALAEWFSGQQLAILARGRAERKLARVESLCAKLAGYGGSATLRDLEKSNGFESAEVKALAVAFPARLEIKPRAAGPKGGRPSEAAFLVEVAQKARNG